MFDDALLRQTTDLFQSTVNAGDIQSSFNVLDINLRTMQQAAEVRNFLRKSLSLQQVESKTDGSLIRALTGDANGYW